MKLMYYDDAQYSLYRVTFQAVILDYHPLLHPIGNSKAPFDDH